MKIILVFVLARHDKIRRTTWFPLFFLRFVVSKNNVPGTSTIKLISGMNITRHETHLNQKEESFLSRCIWVECMYVRTNAFRDEELSDNSRTLKNDVLHI